MCGIAFEKRDSVQHDASTENTVSLVEGKGNEKTLVLTVVRVPGCAGTVVLCGSGRQRLKMEKPFRALPGPRVFATHRD